MFINNLGECEHSLYLGCKNCIKCYVKLESKKRDIIIDIEDKRDYINDILRYKININLEQEFQELKELKKELKEVSRELESL